MQTLELLFAEDEGKRPLHKIDAFEEEEHVELLVHLLTGTIVAVNPFPLWLQGQKTQHPVRRLPKEVAEVILSLYPLCSPL
jgi:hypothetical protein